MSDDLSKLITGEVKLPKIKPKKKLSQRSVNLLRKKDPSVDSMVILIHLLRRYLIEVLKKSKYETENFFKNLNSKINNPVTSLSGETANNKFHRMIQVLITDHIRILQNISKSSRIRENERRVIKQICSFTGSESEVNKILVMLQGINNDAAFRAEINKLISFVDLNLPISPLLPKKFIAFIAQLLNNHDRFEKIIVHIFEKAATSSRMASLQSLIFLALDTEELTAVLDRIIAHLRTLSFCDQAFIRIFSILFLARDHNEAYKQYFKRISNLLKHDLQENFFTRSFQNLPFNQLKQNDSPLVSILRDLATDTPDFLHLLTHQIFIEARHDSLSRITLEVMHRGLVEVFHYTHDKAEDYISKLTESINFFYYHHLPADQKDKSHFYLLLSALNKYSRKLLTDICQSNVFRDTEVKTIMPLITAIRNFHAKEEQAQALESIWNLLQSIRQKKVTRDELTRIHKLTTDESPAYSKDFIPFIVTLMEDQERFKLDFNYILDQTRVDADKNKSTIIWHAELLKNIIKYLSDPAILVVEKYRLLLSILVSKWVQLNGTYICEFFDLLRTNYINTIRDLVLYLYQYSPDTLRPLIQSFTRLTASEYTEKATFYVQFIHMSLLERMHVPGMSLADTEKGIENIQQLIDQTYQALGEEYETRKKEIFSLSYLARIRNLLTVEEAKAPDIFNNKTDSDIPASVIAMINQSAKIFNIQNFVDRALANLSDIVELSSKAMLEKQVGTLSLAEKASELFKFFNSNYRFPRVNNASITHNFAYKNEFDYFSFALLVHIVSRKLGWDEIQFSHTWRDIAVISPASNMELELRNNTVMTSKTLTKRRERYFSDVKKLLRPLKAEVALNTFFHLKNGMALFENRHYRLAAISFDKAIETFNMNIIAHFWKAKVLKKARINFELYERHINIAKKYYPSSPEIDELVKQPF